MALVPGNIQGVRMSMKEEVIETLKLVNDPEIMIDVWTLGLIYDLKVDEPKGDVLITMTFTTPAACAATWTLR